MDSLVPETSLYNFLLSNYDSRVLLLMIGSKENVGMWNGEDDVPRTVT